MLLNARRQAGLSVDDIVAKLKLSRRQVEALEADRYGDLPGNTFVRGFVRNYARLLKLDPQPMLSYLEQHLPSEAPQSALPKLSDDSMPLMRPGGRPGSGLFSKAVLAVLVLLLLLVAAYWLYQRGLTEPGLLLPRASSGDAADKDASAVAPGGPVPTPVEAERVMPPTDAAMPAGGAPEGKPAPAQAAPAVPAQPAPVGATPVPAAPKPPAQTVTAPAPAPTPAVTAPKPQADVAKPVAPPPPVAKPTTTPESTADTADAVDGLKLIAHEESWMTVTDATGKRLINALVKAGESRVLTGTPPYKVRVGNAQHVEILYKGKPSNLKPFTKSDVATLVLN